MTGQMKYDTASKSWKYETMAQMRTNGASGIDTIQSRDGYYRAWAGRFVNGGTDLEALVRWVEKTA